LQMLTHTFRELEFPYELPTNKPYEHYTLFMRIGLNWFNDEALRRGYRRIDGSLAPHVIALLKERGVPENEMVYILNDKDMLKSLDEHIFADAEKDDELFPPPEPIRVEVAGAIITFTTWDAVLVVYLDQVQKGREVKLEIVDWYGKYEAKVIERTSGGAIVCAAVFPCIPIVRDRERNRIKVINQIQAKVQVQELREDIRLFKGVVTEIDWRGQEGQHYFDEQ
jgi:hypothetical protein